MRRWIKILVTGTAGLAVALAGTVLLGRFTFERRVEDEVQQMLVNASTEAVVVTETDVAALPEPVQRWLEWSGVVGKPRPSTVRLRQEGEIRLGPDQAWMPFTADQYYTTDPPAFIWSINTRMMGILPIGGREKYVDGRGNMEIRLLSLVPVVDETGPEMDQGTLLRYLNEIMWFPAAAVSPWITWESHDASSAVATMRYQGVEASATFFFDEDGRITNMTAERYQDAGNGEFKLLPWWTPVSEYGEFNGVRIPVAGEGIWEEEWGDFSYVRLRIVDIEYDVPELW